MSNALDKNYLFELEDFPKYFVGTDLNIYSDKFGKMKKLKAGIDGGGYYKVVLCKDRKQYNKNVHRIIAETFLPNPNNLSDVDHINRNRLDNRLENLRWVSSKDNNRNQGMRKDNTSGFQGVYFDKNKQYWRATWCNKEGKKTQKYFPINKYGEQAKQLALEYREKMVDELYNRV